MPQKTLLPVSRSLVFGGVIVLLWLLCLELAVGLGSTIAPKLFGETATVLSAIDRIDPERFAKFRTHAIGMPAVWSAREGTDKNKSCLGDAFDATYDAAGARVYLGYDARRAAVLLIGDSYTAGDEVGNEHTIAAHLYKRTGIVSANMGIGGYSPLQAVLNFERRASNFPSARVVVLGIMHENIRRNVNSYVAVFTGAEGVLGIRPYVSEGAIRLVPPEIFDSLDQFKVYAVSALQNDFWTTPAFSFPYSVAVSKLLSSRSFWIRNKSRVLKQFSQQYATDFADRTLKGALTVVVNRFVTSAESRHLIPLIIFFPQNKYDLGSPASWIEEYRKGHGYKVSIQMMDSSNIDWSLYNQKPDGSCHASSYGYDMIARGYAKGLEELVSSRQLQPSLRFR